MRVTVNKKNIETAISASSKAIGSKSPLPILSHFLIIAETGCLRILATDLEIGIDYSISASVMEEGSFTTPAKTLQEIISLLPEGDIQITKIDEELEISAPYSSYRLMTLPPDEFPIIPRFEDRPDIIIEQKALREAIKNVVFASASQEETRAVLTGVLLKAKGKEIELIATDGRRLAKMRQYLKNEAPLESEIRHIVPSRILNELSKWLKETDDEVKILIKGGQIFFEMEGIFVLSRMLEGRFPDFDQIIPDSRTVCIKIDRQKFLMAMRRALIMAQEKQNPKLVRISVGGDKIVIRSNTPDLGSGYEEIPALVKGEELDVAFNGNYFIDALSYLQAEKIDFELSTSESPGVIRPEGQENYIYVVMPVRIKEELVEDE